MPDLIKTIGDLPGPQFLLFYAGFAGIVIALTRFLGWRLAAGDRDDPLLIPRQPDPWEAACLRGGENEVARLAVLELIQNGLLQEVKSEGKVRLKSTGAPTPDGFRPNSWQREILDYHALPREPAAMFHPFSGIGFKLRDHVRAEIEPELRRRGLLVRGSDRTLSAVVLTVAVALLISISAWKLGLAQIRGKHNVGGLIAMTFVASALTPWLGWVGRVSARGRRFLKQLSLAFAGLKNDPDPAVERRGDAERALLLAGVFGVGALAGSEWSHVRDLYRRSAASGSGCGGACGVACGGGDGGGGGCGGGGCGGGCGGCGS